MKLSKVFKDRLVPPLEEAVYWTEYVIRHRGAPQLTSAAKNLYWFQYYLIDIILFLCFLLIMLVILSIYLAKLLFILFSKTEYCSKKIKTF